MKQVEQKIRGEKRKKSFQKKVSHLQNSTESRQRKKHRRMKIHKVEQKLSLFSRIKSSIKNFLK